MILKTFWFSPFMPPSTIAPEGDIWCLPVHHRAGGSPVYSSTGITMTCPYPGQPGGIIQDPVQHGWLCVSLLSVLGCHWLYILVVGGQRDGLSLTRSGLDLRLRQSTHTLCPDNIQLISNESSAELVLYWCEKIKCIAPSTWNKIKHEYNSKVSLQDDDQ